MEELLNYNVPHGKQFRGLFVPMTVKCFNHAPSLSTELMKQAYVLGWCVEMFQAFFLVADDIMDGSETRRGKPCWYRVKDVGMVAVTDAFLIENTMYRILANNFGNHSHYTDFLEIFHEASFKTILGQCLDTKTEDNSPNLNLETYNMDHYRKISDLKTSYYTIYLPIVLALTLLEIDDRELFNKLEEISMNVGYLFQIQDDFLDCYGNEAKTGKIGTDIQNGKCSWLYVTAVELDSAERESMLKLNYGKNDPACVNNVKAVYNDLNIPNVYDKAVFSIKEEIFNKMEFVDCEPIKVAISNVLETIVDRQK